MSKYKVCLLSLTLFVYMFACKSPGNQMGTKIQVTFIHYYLHNYLVCAPCRCSRTRGRSPGRAAAGLAPCVASYPCLMSGTTPGHWGNSEHTWSPPGDVHILCCWWRKSGDHTQQGPVIEMGGCKLLLLTSLRTGEPPCRLGLAGDITS